MQIRNTKITIKSHFKDKFKFKGIKIHALKRKFQKINFRESVMKKLIFVALFSAVGLFAADGATLYKTCIACHGAGGDKVPPGSKATFTINSLDKNKLIEDIKGYKAGTLNQYGLGAQMKPFLAKLTDADITALAEYITTLKK